MPLDTVSAHCCRAVARRPTLPSSGLAFCVGLVIITLQCISAAGFVIRLWCNVLCRAGILYDITNSWSLALFAPSIFLFLTGSAAFVLFGRAEAQVRCLALLVRPLLTPLWGCLPALGLWRSTVPCASAGL